MSAKACARTVNAWTHDDLRGAHHPPTSPVSTHPPAREVVIVTFEQGQILDVTGPLEVFSHASRFVPEVRYSTQVVTSSGGPVTASCGLEFTSLPIADITGPIDTLMVAGGAWIDAAVADAELLAHIRRLAADARRVTSVCSGAFLLAAAGLLDGRRATTHWADCQQLDEMYADVTVDLDAIYVNDGNVWTSAGVTAGIDLSLALVADDHGHQAATTVARQLVVYLQRSAAKPSSPHSSPGKRRTPSPFGTCWPGCVTISPTTCPFRRLPGRSTSPSGSSPASSRPRWVPQQRTMSKPSGSSPPAGFSRPQIGPSNRSPGPAASEHLKP